MLPARAAWSLTVVATATLAVSYVERQAVAALAPTITADLGIGDAAFGWLDSAFSIAYRVGAPIAGRLIDRVGARRGLTASVIAWSAVAALHALVPGFAVRFVLRILLGLAEAPSFPGAARTVARALPPASRAAGFGVLFTGSSLGAALAAVLAPTLEAEWGWRLAVVASVPVVGLVLQFGAKIPVTHHGVTRTAVREHLWLPPLAFDAGAVLFGALGTARARRLAGTGAPPSPRALFAVAAALCLAVGAVSVSPGPWTTTLVSGLALAGAGGIYALATADMLSRVPADRVAAAGGITAAAQSLALIVAFPLIGAVAQSEGSYALAALGLAVWVVPGVGVWLARGR